MATILKPAMPADAWCAWTPAQFAGAIGTRTQAEGWLDLINTSADCPRMSVGFSHQAMPIKEVEGGAVAGALHRQVQPRPAARNQRCCPGCRGCQPRGVQPTVALRIMLIERLNSIFGGHPRSSPWM